MPKLEYKMWFFLFVVFVTLKTLIDILINLLLINSSYVTRFENFNNRNNEPYTHKIVGKGLTVEDVNICLVYTMIYVYTKEPSDNIITVIYYQYFIFTGPPEKKFDEKTEIC